MKLLKIKTAFEKQKSMKPIATRERYLKFGVIITEHTFYKCPRCGDALNAGPEYQPEYCSNCGQKIDFADAKWISDKTIRFLTPEEEEAERKQRGVS